MRALLASLLLLAGACRRSDIEVTRVPKSPEGPSAMGAMTGQGAASMPGALPPGHPAIAGAQPRLGGGAAAEQPAAGLKWTAPAGWTHRPAGGMRLATFGVPTAKGDAELAVVVLSGEAGGALANVNRWRGQVGLAPWDESAFRAGAQTVKAPAGPFTFVDLPGSGQHMLAASLLKDGEAWFFKLLGPDQTVAAAAPAFKTFLTSVSPTH